MLILSIPKLCVNAMLEKTLLAAEARQSIWGVFDLFWHFTDQIVNGFFNY